MDVAKKKKKGKFKRETESLLIAAQNNAIRTNHIKARINKTEQNSKCGDRDKTINHISECSKLAQKDYKTRHDWVGQVIHWELCKKFQFNPTNRRCPCCSRYSRRKWTRRHEFKSWTRLIAFHIALIPLGKLWIQLFSLQLWVNSRTD